VFFFFQDYSLVNDFDRLCHVFEIWHIFVLYFSFGSFLPCISRFPDPALPVAITKKIVRFNKNQQQFVFLTWSLSQSEPLIQQINHK